MILPASYSNGFAPRDGSPLYPELWRGCVGAWAPCLGPTGLNLMDWSGAKRHAPLVNMAASNAWILRDRRYALNCPDSDDRITITAANSGPIYDRGTGDFAIAMHMSAEAGSYRGVFGNMTTFGNGIILGRNTTNWGGYLGNSTELNSGHAIPTDGSWHQYGVQRSGSTVSWWVDGKQTSTTHTNSNSLAGTSATTWGFCNGYSLWPGGVDDLRIYSVPLSSRQWITLATRRGIAYELAPRRRSAESIAAFNRRRRLLLGAQS